MSEPDRPTAAALPQPRDAARNTSGRAVMILFGAACLLPVLGDPYKSYITPPVALAAGVVVALLGLNGFARNTGKLAKVLIQISIVLLGLSMDLHEVLRAGLAGVAFAAGTILGTFALGIVLGRMLRTGATLTTLISSGTSICGGSAIAATGPVIGANAAQMAVATGTVFILNGIALYIFPPLGTALAMTQQQFGTWAAVAIHDISSVVGAATQFDRTYLAGHPGVDPNHALEVATAVKLTRTLWIAPVVLIAAWAFNRWKLGDHAGGKAKVPIPWFIALFVLAAAVRTFWPAVKPVADHAADFAKAGMTTALFLIGAGMSVAAVKQAGWRVMALGVVLWVFISVVAVFVVRATVT